MTLGRTALTGTVVALTLLTGACTVVPSERRDAGRISQDRFQEAGAVRYDLTTPPANAQELGVGADQTSAAFNRQGGPYWDYEILLPEGRVFRTKGFGHVVNVDPNPLGRADSVLTNSRLTDLAAAQAELEAAAPVLGLDLTQIRDWATRAKRVPLTDRSPTDNMNFLGPQLGYLLPGVEARRDSSTDEVTLNWYFDWNSRRPDQVASPSAAPTAST